jgi:hypothetical protein
LNRILIIALLFLPFSGLCDAYPIRFVKGFMVTEAVIEGETVMVILDTGAPGLVLNQEYYTADSGPGIACSGINGSFEAFTYQVNDWSWLGTNHKKTTALVTDLSFLELSLNREIHALIGLSALEDFFVSIDYDQHLITVTKETPTDIPAIFSRFQYVNHLPVITCSVNGQKKILGLDSGSAGNYLFDYDQPMSEDLLADASPILVTGTDNQEDIKHQVPMMLEVLDSEINLQSTFIVDLRDKGSFKHAGFDGILGQAFLSNYNITIHPGKQKIWLQKRGDEGSFVSATMP